MIAALLFLAMFASACSSSSDDSAAVNADADDTSLIDSTATEPGEETSTADTATLGDDDAETAQLDPEPTAEVNSRAAAVPDDDSAAGGAVAGPEDAEPASPADAAQGFVRNRFNIDPSPEAIGCIVDQSSDDPALELALTSPQVALGEIDDTQLRALAYAMNGCVDSTSLGEWATLAVGSQGDVADTAPACFADRFKAADDGDLVFYTVVALTYQFRVDQTGVPPATDTFVNCTPVSSLGDFFASQAEQASGFSTVVDRDCLITELSDPAASELFWSTLIEGAQPAINVMSPIVDRCTADAGAGLSDAIPADFVPWSGTGALTSVLPAARAGVYSEAPPMAIDAARTYEAVLTTGGGDIRIRLLAETAPITVNNFVSLARDGYYDGTTFHRVLDGFMAQGGDPTGTGTGGPGYSFQDEFDGGPSLDRKGLLAMANSGPNSNGSQFFITFVEVDRLTGRHTVFGEVVEGIELVEAIERRDPSAPNGRGQVLESVTIVES